MIQFFPTFSVRLEDDVPFFYIPTNKDFPFYELQTTLDGVAYRLRFKFNSRDEAWYLDILDTDDNVLRSSLRIVSDFPLLRTWQSENRPSGELLAFDTTNETDVAGLEQLVIGGDVVLVYSGES